MDVCKKRRPGDPGLLFLAMGLGLFLSVAISSAIFRARFKSALSPGNSSGRKNRAAELQRYILKT